MNDNTGPLPPDYKSQFDTFCKLYQAFALIVSQFPINPKVKDYIGFNFDQGFMWAENAFRPIIADQLKNESVPGISPSSSPENPDDSEVNSGDPEAEEPPAV